MKKFVFSLHSVLQYKLTLEKSQKADLAAAQKVLRELYAEKERLKQAYERNVASLQKAITENEDIAGNMARHDAYFRHLREQNKDLAKKIALAEQERNRRQALLVKTMKEIQSYEKLRDEQYALYLEEVRREEDKEIGDIVSHKIITE